MEHLDTTCSPSRQEHQKKGPVSGGETPSPASRRKGPAERRKGTAKKAPQNEKRPCAPLTLRFGRIVEVEVLGWRMECYQEDSSAVWGQLHHGWPQKLWLPHPKRQSPRLSGVAPGLEEGNGRGTWRTKKAFHLRGGPIFALG